MPALKTDALIQPIGCFSFGAGGEVDRSGAVVAGILDSCPAERFTDPSAAVRLIDDHIAHQDADPFRSAFSLGQIA